MAKDFPKKLFVKIDTVDEEEYYVASDNKTGLGELGVVTRVATYKLVKSYAVEGVVKKRKKIKS